MNRFAHARLLGGVALALGAALVGCGGGGGGGGSVSASVAATVDVSLRASVTAASLSAAKYSQPLLLTVSGSHLDNGLLVTATGCAGVALSSTAPYVSSASTAYYQCTATTLGAGQFVATRTLDGAVLTTQPFTVPAPQVTLTYSNGAAVNGTMVFTLAPDKAPITVNNFLAYVNSGFYVGTLVHRMSPNFVIQAGGFAAPVVDAAATLKPTTAPIELEVNTGLSNTQWSVAMARSAAANSATSQFFINLADNSAVLDANAPVTDGYAVFGSVSAGTGLVTQIVAAPCTAFAGFLPSGDCTPSPNVVITAAVQTQ